MNLNSLPDISFATRDARAIETETLAAFERFLGATLYPATPERLFGEALAYREAVVNAAIDYAGRMNLLAYAKGGHLDHLGAFMGVTRLAPSPARTMLEFRVSDPLTFPVSVPAGSRVTTRDSSPVFATATSIEIAPGLLSATAPAVALEAGAAGNGLAPGQLSELVDALPYIASVSNVELTLGGSDQEDDEHFRERIQLAPESYSNAGSEGAYRFHALSAHSDIASVAVDTPSPGVVDVRPVLKGGELPDAALLALVRDVLSARDVRPLTDKVEVSAPDVVEYAVSGRWWLRRSDAALTASVTAAIADALETYRVWQRSEPGRDINPTRLISLIERAGAKRVELDAPAFTPLTPVQIARETSIELTFAGLEHE